MVANGDLMKARGVKGAVWGPLVAVCGLLEAVQCLDESS